MSIFTVSNDEEIADKEENKNIDREMIKGFRPGFGCHISLIELTAWMIEI